jgi:hypothetical protein
VTSHETWDIFDPDVLAALLQADSGARVLEEYLECRRVLEVEAAGLAAERATPQDLDELSAAFAAMTETAERARANPVAESLYHDADIRFHAERAVREIARASIQLRDLREPASVVRDPNDDFLVALALTAGARAIVTGDRDLLDHPGLNPPALTVRASGASVHSGGGL